MSDDEVAPSAQREAYADPDFVIVRMSAVRVLGSWEAAGCFQRIAWRCERSGEWRATMQEIADEIGVSVRTAKRITTKLRELGWVAAERSEAYKATLTWSIRWADEGTPESANLAPSTREGTPEEAIEAPSESANEAPSPSTKTGETKNETRRGTRLPEDFEVSAEMRQWWSEHPELHGLYDPKMEHEKFCDYWRARPGQQGVKLDWFATWRNWMRSAAQRAQGGRGMGNVHHLPTSDADRQQRARAFGD